LLGLHFRIEHAGRWSRGLPFNFNGTAGVWRREAIEDSGGWSSATVAEDLYLSYKVQMRGWDLVYRGDIPTPSELPWSLSAFIVQQRRWARGNGQVFRLLATTIGKEQRLPLRARWDMFFHLSGYGFSTLILAAYLASPIWIVAKASWLASSSFFDSARIFDLSLWVALIASYLSLFMHRLISDGPDKALTRFFDVFCLLAFSPVLIALIAPSYFKGLMQTPETAKQSVFHRTPKSKNQEFRFDVPEPPHSTTYK
jgi:cellulose synthase/poly-beta-1,6-N-acetylglucosamine synthase-like glycosyltransferase